MSFDDCTDTDWMPEDFDEYDDPYSPDPGEVDDIMATPRVTKQDLLDRVEPFIITPTYDDDIPF